MIKRSIPIEFYWVGRGFVIEKTGMNSENQNQNQNPQIVRRVFKELEQLSSESLEGIKLITNDANLLDIQAIIDGPGELFFSWNFLVHTSRRHWKLTINFVCKLRLFQLELPMRVVSCD